MDIIKISAELSIGEINKSKEVFEFQDEKGAKFRYNSDQYVRHKIGQTLELCYKMVGLPKDRYPVSDEAKLIALNIQKYHADLTFRDILHAFELGVNEVINVKLDHYHTVGVKYIVNILKSYKVYRQKVELNIQRKFDDINSDKMKEYQDRCKRNDKAIKKMIVFHYSEFLKTRKRENSFMTKSCYQLLNEIGLIQVDAKTKWKLVEAAEVEIKAGINPFKKALRTLSKEDVNSLAMVLTIYKQFEKFDQESISVISLARKLVSSCCILSSNHYRNIYEIRRKNS